MVSSPVGLEGSIILLVVGIILWAVSRAVGTPVSTALFWIGILLIVLGVIFLAIWAVNYALLLAPLLLL
jgi:hypothetical protein